ncbi:MAG: hypothetical protein LUF01_13050 [Bacteroides sp.]|nr:hypothetical protein [Bacteroides sp.]
MRTKHVLMAMVLPALFAACSSDEFVEPTQGTLNGRAVLNGLTVNVDQNADARFAWANYSWKFETGDQFGAAVTDPTAGIDNVQDNQLLGNYIFSQQADGSYKTTSQMYEGVYSFYGYPKFESKATRDLIKFNLGVQKADLNKPEEVINNTQLFFSPLYDIKAENIGIALPLKFYPYYSVAAFKIKNNTGKAFKISQIVLKATKFITEGEISPVKIKNAGLVYSVAKDATEYTLPKDTKYDEKMATADLVKGTPTSNTSIALNCDNYELADGKDVVAYMSVPASVTDQGNVTVDIIVNVDGVSKAVKVTETATTGTPSTTTSIASTGINALKFQRGQTKVVFGFETDGKTMKALNVAAKNLQDANGYYVDNKADLLEVINNNRGGIDIYNMGDLAIDNDIAKALALYTASGVTFANPIAIKATGKVSIDKVTFDGGVTVESGEVTFEAGTVLSASKTMEVKGGKAILKDGKYDNATSQIIVNGGEVVIAENDAAITSIDVKQGTLTLNGKSQTIGTSGIAELTFSDATKNTTLAVALAGDAPAAKTLTIAAVTTLNAKTAMTIASGNTVAISNNIVLTNNGKIENSGKISVGTGTSALVNETTGTIETAGSIAGITNKDYIKLTDGWFSSVTMGDNGDAGLVDNTVGGTVDLDSKTGNTVYRVYADVTDPTIKGTATEVAVLKNVTFTKDATITPIVLFLGNTEILSGTATASTKAVIGVTNDYEALAAKVLNTTWNTPATNTVANYNATVSMKVQEDAELDASAVGGYEVATGVVTLLNKGVVTVSQGTVGLDKWTPTNAVAKQ